MSEKKKLRETKVGAFLASKAPALLKKIGEVLPDQGGLAIVKNLITSDTKIKAIDKEQAMKLIEQDLIEMENVSKRWDSDMKSDSWLSKAEHRSQTRSPSSEKRSEPRELQEQRPRQKQGRSAEQ